VATEGIRERFGLESALDYPDGGENLQHREGRGASTLGESCGYVAALATPHRPGETSLKSGTAAVNQCAQPVPGSDHVILSEAKSLP